MILDILVEYASIQFFFCFYKIYFLWYCMHNPSEETLSQKLSKWVKIIKWLLSQQSTDWVALIFWVFGKHVAILSKSFIFQLLSTELTQVLGTALPPTSSNKADIHLLPPQTFSRIPSIPPFIPDINV